MPRDFACPFWAWEKQLCSHCEGGKLRFPDEEARAQWLDRYCANQPGWRSCEIARMLVEAYDRREN